MPDTLEITPELKAALPDMREAIYGSGASSQPSTSIQPPVASAETAATSSSKEETVQLPSAAPTIDYTKYLQEKFGFDNEDLALQAITEWKALKENPPKPELTFPDEESRKWHEYITNKKEDELYTSLHARQQVKNLDSMKDEEKLKLFIKMNNPLYDNELIDAVYQKNYTFNEANFKDEDGNITDPLAYRLAKVDALQKMQADTKKANEFFAQYKSQITLPDINTAPVIDPGYQEFQTILQKDEENRKSLEAQLAKLTEKEATYAFKFNDEANKFEFDINYTPDQKSLESAKNAAANWFEFLNTNYRLEDGSPLTDKWLKHLAILQDLDKYTATVVTQAINAERKRYLTQAKQPGGIPRNYNIDPEGQNMEKNRQSIYGKTG